MFFICLFSVNSFCHKSVYQWFLFSPSIYQWLFLITNLHFDTLVFLQSFIPHKSIFPFINTKRCKSYVLPINSLKLTSRISSFTPTMLFTTFTFGWSWKDGEKTIYQGVQLYNCTLPPPLEPFQRKMHLLSVIFKSRNSGNIWYKRKRFWASLILLMVWYKDNIFRIFSD